MGISMGKIGRGLKKGKGGGSSTVDIDKLRDAIQNLCQSTNPLGKCMDYVHEDVETMKKELEKWKQMYQSAVSELEEEERNTEQDLTELRRSLQAQDEKIEEQMAKCNNTKASIAKNDLRINELLRMVVTG